MPPSEPGSWMSRRVTVTGKLGLHARPAARFVKLVQTFDAEVEVSNRAGRVSAGSIMGLMMLAASTGSEVEISARGPQAAEALEALVEFVESGFGDD